MTKTKNKKKRLAVILVSALLLGQLQPVASVSAAQGEDGLCAHHPEHTPECGYAAASEGSPCTHEHTEACSGEEKACVHEHTPECYALSCGIEEHTHAEECYGEPALVCAEEHEHTEGCYAAGALSCTLEEHAHTEECYSLACAHVCSAESGCVTEKRCVHEDYPAEDGTEIKAVHDETCGYAEASEGSPCTFVCGECKAEEEAAKKAEEEAKKAEEEARKEAEIQQKIQNVRDLLLALPEAEVVQTLLENPQEQGQEPEAYRTQVDEAKAAYDGLLPEEQAQVEPELLEKLQRLLDCFAAPVMQLAAPRGEVGETFEVVGAYVKCKITVRPSGDMPGTVELIRVSDPNALSGDLELGEVEYNGEQYHITSVGADAFQLCIGLNTVSLPYVTSVSKNAFQSCINLNTVNLDSVESIENEAFRSCSALKNVYMPKVQRIEESAFAYCEGLDSITLPGSLKYLGKWAFQYSGLTSLTCEGMTAPEIDPAAFAFSSVTSLTIPEGATGYTTDKGWPAITKDVSITGTVTDVETGTPIPDASVTVTLPGEGGDPISISGTTDENGTYTLSLGTRIINDNRGYTVTAVKPGYISGEASGVITGASNTMDIALRQEDPVATVTDAAGTTEYTSLDDAAAAAVEAAATAATETDVVLTLLKSVERTEPLVLSGKMTFDLGGCTLSDGWENVENEGVLEIAGGVVQVKSGNVSVLGASNLIRAVVVREGATLSGDATYSGNTVLYNNGTISGGTFNGYSYIYGKMITEGIFQGYVDLDYGVEVKDGVFRGKVGCGPDCVITGGTFENAEVTLYGGIFQGGSFTDCTLLFWDDGCNMEQTFAPGYVAYDENGKVVISRQSEFQHEDTMTYTGTIAPHVPHAYEYVYTQDEQGTYTCMEQGTCPDCGATAPPDAGYTVTIPKTAQLDGDTRVSVHNKLSREQTVTVSAEEQVTLTRQNDAKTTQITSAVTFAPLSVPQGGKAEGAVTFAKPVYNGDTDAVIPAGTYTGTLNFTIELQEKGEDNG